MKKFVGPYTQTKLVDDLIAFERKVFNSKNSFIVWEQHRLWHATTMYNSSFETKEAAMEALDTTIVERGYTILTQDQCDKYSILL